MATKTQASQEIIVTISVMIIIFSFAFLISSQKNVEASKLKSYISGKDLCIELSTLFDETVANGNGSQKTLFISSKLNFKPYNISITNGTTIMINNTDMVLFCTTKANVTNGTSNRFSILPGWRTIVNNNTRVTVS